MLRFVVVHVEVMVRVKGATRSANELGVHVLRSGLGFGLGSPQNTVRLSSSHHSSCSNLPDSTFNSRYTPGFLSLLIPPCDESSKCLQTCLPHHGGMFNFHSKKLYAVSNMS